jgi:hypothetical protein
VENPRSSTDWQLPQLPPGTPLGGERRESSTLRGPAGDSGRGGDNTRCLRKCDNSAVNATHQPVGVEESQQVVCYFAKRSDVRLCCGKREAQQGGRTRGRTNNTADDFIREPSGFCAPSQQ